MSEISSIRREKERKNKKDLFPYPDPDQNQDLAVGHKVESHVAETDQEVETVPGANLGTDVFHPEPGSAHSGSEPQVQIETDQCPGMEEDQGVDPVSDRVLVRDRSPRQEDGILRQQ